MKVFVKEGPEAEYFAAHKKMGKRLYLAITVTALMGCSMYPLLFVL
jgi:hypothetical protein